jgi:transcriptional regulator with XRE-family HTH domain
MSISALARAVGVSQPYMSRVIRAKNYKSAAAGDLLRRVANALDLPDDYFAEARQKYLMDRIASDPKLRDELYQRVRRADEKANR